MSDSDSDISITTTAMGEPVKYIDNYFLNPFAPEWKPKNPAKQNMEKIYADIHETTKNMRQQELWNLIVSENRDKLYDWVIFMPVIHIDKNFFGQGRLRLSGQKLSKRNIAYLLFRGRKGVSPPNCIKKITKRIPSLEIHDVWYDMPEHERDLITAYFKVIGFDWFDKHIV
jgi:disulfide oxidoreductase YuzD